MPAALDADAMAGVERSHLRQGLGAARLFFNLEAAVEACGSRAPRRAGAAPQA